MPICEVRDGRCIWDRRICEHLVAVLERDPSDIGAGLSVEYEIVQNINRNGYPVRPVPTVTIAWLKVNRLSGFWPDDLAVSVTVWLPWASPEIEASVEPVGAPVVVVPSTVTSKPMPLLTLPWKDTACP